ncbi:hypothetical protein BU23DRAFT_166499 [Bimuria novae-zelandiae CBS 107.79]|uniref:Myb-like domain-containing protein n=1 Tax=Bimuria novae-zelandiae CBS 107.79 TaxID=1447943 RepID=A0A6A5V4T9_9PLEO|nr:hypothetical protein BU23DRAFT_166499 [Bimuria novae-zelandiae CBS 107.79]
MSRPGIREASQSNPYEESSQENVVVVLDSQLGIEAIPDDPHREDDSGLDMCNRFEAPCAWTTEHCNNGVTGTIAAAGSEVVDRANTQASELPQGQQPSIPQTSPSVTDIEISTQETSRGHTKDITCHRSGLMENLVDEEKFPGRENTSSGSSNGDNDIDDVGYSDVNGPSRTHKRKRFPPANSASRKRQSRGSVVTAKQSTTPTVSSAMRQVPIPSRKAVSGGRSDVRLASAAQSSVDHFETSSGEDSSAASSDGESDWGDTPRKPLETKQRRAWRSRMKAEKPLSAPSPVDAKRETRWSDKLIPPRQMQWRISDLSFHSLSVDMSYLTAIIRARNGLGVLPTGQAVTLLKNIVGNLLKLENITIKPLTSDTWFLAGFVDLLTDPAGCGRSQPLRALLNTVSERNRGWHRNDVNNDDDETLYKSLEKTDDSEEEYLSDIADKPPSSKTYSRWSEDDDDRLRGFKKEGRPWAWIYKQFPERSPGAVQVHWHSKLRGRS